MQVRKNEYGYIVRFEAGEEMIALLKKFCKENDFRAAAFTAIGATTKIELGFYELSSKRYHWKEFSGEYEVTGGVGNISIFENDIVIHMHTSIADITYRAYGGHVRSLVVGATLEVVLTRFGDAIERKSDEKIGLNLWSI